MNDTDERLGMGWLPDYPDFRDYTEEHEEVNYEQNINSE
jgi:hypothetical protein